MVDPDQIVHFATSDLSLHLTFWKKENESP